MNLREFYVKPTRDIHFLTMKNILIEKMPVLYHLQCHCRRTCIDPRLYFFFFDGLIPEGWSLDVVSRNWKIDVRDRFGLSLVACRDAIGNVSVREDRI